MQGGDADGQKRLAARDLDFVQRNSVLAPVTILPPVSITLGTERSRNRPLYVWKMSSDASPTQPPQLYSKN